MKTLHDLSKEIQQHPDRKNELLASFRTSESDIRHFLFSLQEVDVYIVPALLETFAVKWKGSDQPAVIKDFIDKPWALGAVFDDIEGNGYTFCGVTSSGKAMCRPDNTNLVVELDVNMAVKNVF
jgi:hypothetical protein